MLKILGVMGFGRFARLLQENLANDNGDFNKYLANLKAYLALMPLLRQWHMLWQFSQNDLMRDE